MCIALVKRNADMREQTGELAQDNTIKTSAMRQVTSVCRSAGSLNRPGKIVKLTGYAMTR